MDHGHLKEPKDMIIKEYAQVRRVSTPTPWRSTLVAAFPMGNASQPQKGKSDP
jgi:hypothetical protein